MMIINKLPSHISARPAVKRYARWIMQCNNDVNKCLNNALQRTDANAIKSEVYAAHKIMDTIADIANILDAHGCKVSYIVAYDENSYGEKCYLNYDVKEYSIGTPLKDIDTALRHNGYRVCNVQIALHL